MLNGHGSMFAIVVLVVVVTVGLGLVRLGKLAEVVDLVSDVVDLLFYF